MRVAMTNIPSDDQILTFREWCRLNALSTRTGWRVIRSPGGPVVTKLSERRFGISVRNNRLWQQSRERTGAHNEG